MPKSAHIASVGALFSATQFPSYDPWNVNIGTSAYMTFNCHWMHNLKSHYILIRLADGSMIYSKGVGTMQFNPVLGGKEMVPLDFINMLYVPSLSSNLLSGLYLTMDHYFNVLIQGDTMHFIKDNQTMFRAQVKHSNAAFLVGDTIPAEELASLSSITTLFLDWDLWHHHLWHHHLAGVKKLSSGNLMTGFKLDSQAEPDPVCEACKAGKIHADPFPSLFSRASRPLQLVHSDVYGPLKVLTHQGHCYWVIFIKQFI